MGSEHSRSPSTDPVEGGSCNTYDYTCGDPVNGLDLDGTKNVGFDPNDPAIVRNVDDCRGKAGPEYASSDFCKGFLSGYYNGDLTAYGFGFVGDEGAGLSIKGAECPSWVWVPAKILGLGGFGRAAVSSDPFGDSWSTFVVGYGEELIGMASETFKYSIAPYLTAGATVVDAVCSGLDYYANS